MLVSGEYADGRTSRVEPATLSIADAMAVIQIGAKTKRYPLATITISSRLGSTPRYLTFEDGGQFQTQDNDAIDKLLPDKVGRSGLLHAMESHIGMTLISIGVVVLLVVGVVTVGIPKTAEYVAHSLPQEMADEFGTNNLKLLDLTTLKPSELPAHKQAEIRAGLRSITDKHTNISIHFRAGIPNAYALPDGSVVLTDELFEVLTSAVEIKAIVYHEVGHVEHRHLLRRALQGSAITMLLFLLTGDLSSFDFLAALPAVLVDLSYSREFELEADRYALDAIIDAGMNPEDFRRALVKLMNWYGVGNDEYASVIHYLSTHPAPDERVEEILAYIADK